MSITMDTTLASLVTNKRRVSALKSLGIVTVGDALTYYYPSRVTELVPLRAIREAAPRPADAFAAVIRDMRVVPMNARRGYRLEATVDDADFARVAYPAHGPAIRSFGIVNRMWIGSVCDCAPARPWWSPVCPANTWVSCSSLHPETTVASVPAGAGAGLEGYAGARHPAMVRLREVPIRMPVCSPRIRRPRLPLPGPR